VNRATTPLAELNEMNGYYSIDHGGYGDLKALLRVSEAGSVFERASFEGWVVDATLVGHWLDPGSDFVEPVDRATAERLAARFGLELG
jgi:hypothetical protein